MELTKESYACFAISSAPADSQKPGFKDQTNGENSSKMIRVYFVLPLFSGNRSIMGSGSVVTASLKVSQVHCRAQRYKTGSLTAM